MTFANDKMIFRMSASLLSLLLLGHVTLLTGYREAANEGNEFFKVYLIVFVLVQIAHDGGHGVWVLLGLKQC